MTKLAACLMMEQGEEARSTGRSCASAIHSGCLASSSGLATTMTPPGSTSVRHARGNGNVQVDLRERSRPKDRIPVEFVRRCLRHRH
ncbi:hypothetical protein MTP99_014713 [Tenebrio molitor]|nr:hypothetical protein MTP99_014713 [Tenebrio molitor]